MERKGIQSPTVGTRSPLEVQIERRKFLAASLGLFGTLPFFQLFRIGKLEDPYFFLASIIGKYSPEQDRSNIMNEKVFRDINDQMLSQKKILKFRFIQLKNNRSFLYIFNSKKSYLAWQKAIDSLNQVSSKKLPRDTRCFQTEGFLA